MKKLIGMLLAVGLVAGGAWAGGDQEKAKAPGDKAAGLEKIIQEYDRQAEKALGEGKADVAAALKKCAEAKRKAAKAMADDSKDLAQEAKKEYKAAREELEKLAPEFKIKKGEKKDKPQAEPKADDEGGGGDEE